MPWSSRFRAASTGNSPIRRAERLSERTPGSVWGPVLRSRQRARDTAKTPCVRSKAPGGLPKLGVAGSNPVRRSGDDPAMTGFRGDLRDAVTASELCLKISLSLSHSVSISIRRNSDAHGPVTEVTRSSPRSPRSFPLDFRCLDAVWSATASGLPGAGTPAGSAARARAESPAVEIRGATVDNFERAFKPITRRSRNMCHRHGPGDVKRPIRVVA
jgi:hypothetical protein